MDLSTSISDLPITDNGNESTQMANNILNEINQEDQVSQASHAPFNQQPNYQPAQIPGMAHMQPQQPGPMYDQYQPDLMNAYNQSIIMPPDAGLSKKTDEVVESGYSAYFNELGAPLIVGILVVLLNSTVLQRMLVRYIPNMINRHSGKTTIMYIMVQIILGAFSYWLIEKFWLKRE